LLFLGVFEAECAAERGQRLRVATHGVQREPASEMALDKARGRSGDARIRVRKRSLVLQTYAFFNF
jgi:hypothetical protein